MKIRIASLHGLAVIILGAAILDSARAQSFFINFNTPGDLNNNFNLYENSTPVVIGTPTTAGSPYSESATGGVGGSGKVAIALPGAGIVPDSTAIYKFSAFDFSTVGLTLNISAMVNVVAAGETGNRLLHLGFANEPNAGLNGNAGLAFMGFRLNPTAVGSTVFSPQWQTKTAAAGVVNTSGGGNQTLTAGNWYQVSITFSNQGGGSILGSGFVQDFGAAGTTAGSVTTLTPTALTSTDIAADVSVWAAFRSFANDGAAGLDDFLANAVGVPEPGAMTLLAIGFGSFLVLRRKLRN